MNTFKKSIIINRYFLVKSWGLVVILATMLFSAVPAWAQARREINSLTPAQLQALRDGVATMKARNVGPSGNRNTASFRTSWEFWTNMHGYYGVGCDPGPIPTLGMIGVHTWSGRNEAEIQQWCKCAHRTPYFLIWHRMFVLTFEQVLRSAAMTVNPNSTAHRTLTLPYWDIQANPQLPLALREPTYLRNGRQVPNPLYNANRAATLNNGQAQVAPSIRNRAASVLTITTDINNNGRVYDDFITAMESSPHGAIHCAVSVNSSCSNGTMGKLATAASDPIFWLHHANIDRLYNCWLTQRGGPAPVLADGVNPNQVFEFVSPEGRRRSLRVGQLNQLLRDSNVSYIQPANCAAAPRSTPVTSMTLARASEPANAETPNFVGVKGIEVKSAVEPPSTSTASRASKTASSSSSVEKKVQLLLKGIVPDPSGRLFDVYLVNRKDRSAFVGTIEFFSSAHHHNHHKGHKVDFEFDATEGLKELNELPKGKLRVVLVPTSGLEFVKTNKAVPLEEAEKSPRSSTARNVAPAVPLEVESASFSLGK